MFKIKKGKVIEMGGTKPQKPPKADCEFIETTATSMIVPGSDTVTVEGMIKCRKGFKLPLPERVNFKGFRQGGKETDLPDPSFADVNPTTGKFGPTKLKIQKVTGTIEFSADFTDSVKRVISLPVK